MSDSDTPPVRRRRRWPLLLLLALPILPVVFSSCIVRQVGGASSKPPTAIPASLSPGARTLLDGALEGLSGTLLDHHTHIVGLGRGGTGCKVNARMQSWAHPMDRIKFEVYASAAGISDLAKGDAQFVARLVSLIRAAPAHGRHMLLAFDQHYRKDGTVDQAKTEFYVPNDYVLGLAEKYPDCFLPAVSVHPYRKDAVPELVRCAKRGARLVKWLPNAMGMDPSDPACDPLYAVMKKHKMVLLSHSGEEQAVDAEEDQELGNPLRLRRPLDQGVQVIVAHCASLGTSRDLDFPERGRSSSFELFLRLMEVEKYRGLLFGEISAMTQFNRIGLPLTTMLDRSDLHHRLVNGSDYPLPAINILVRTRSLVAGGYISEQERGWLNELYDANPLLYDLALKRTIKAPGGVGRFPAQVFLDNPRLGLIASWDRFRSSKK